MRIDWFTVTAQLLNFLILVWLLKRFLYKPILHAIDAREKRIAKELSDADTSMREAEKERERFRKKNEEFDQQRNELLGKVKDEAEGERRRLFDEARRDSDAVHAKRQDALRREQENLNAELTRRTREEVFAITRKTLTDLANASLEARMSDLFTHRLRELDGEAKQSLAKALKTSAEPALVRSAFDLPIEQQTAIQQALNKTFSAGIRIRFETAPELVSGIEFSVNGQKIAWSISEYLGSLEKSIGERLQERPAPKAISEAKDGPKPTSETKPSVPDQAT